MKRVISILVLVSISLICMAQTKEAVVDIRDTDECLLLDVFTENKSIKIGSETLVSGGLFKVCDKIHWGKKSDGKYKNEKLRVRNLRTKERLFFCAKEFEDAQYYDVFKLYIKKNKLGYKDSNAPSVIMDSIMSDRQYMILDTVLIKSRLPMEYGKGYMIRAIGDGEGEGYKTDFEVLCLRETNEIVITKDLLLEQGIDITERPVKFTVTYWNDGVPTPITDDMIIEYIP